MLRSFFIICFLCSTLSASYSQPQRFEYKDTTLMQQEKEEPVKDENDDTEEAETAIDTTLYRHTIKISHDTIFNWKKNKRFAYINYLDSLLKAEQKKAPHNGVQTSKPSFLQWLLNADFIQWIFRAVAITFVLFILYKLFLSKGIFKREMPLPSVKEVITEDRIDKPVAYDELIRQSFKLEDYRMAIRYLFLKTLSQLSEKELLHWSAGKTNFSYVQEIRKDKKNEFASLVLNYEYVWYGRLNINREQYEKMEKDYARFYNKI